MFKKLLLSLSTVLILAGCALPDALLLSHSKPLVPVYQIRTANVMWNKKDDLKVSVTKLVVENRTAPITDMDKYIALSRTKKLLETFDLTIRDKLIEGLRANKVTIGEGVLISLTPISSTYSASAGKPSDPIIPEMTVLAELINSSGEKMWTATFVTTLLNRNGFEHIVDDTVIALLDAMKKEGWLAKEK